MTAAARTVVVAMAPSADDACLSDRRGPFDFDDLFRLARSEAERAAVARWIAKRFDEATEVARPTIPGENEGAPTRKHRRGAKAKVPGVLAPGELLAEAVRRGLIGREQIEAEARRRGLIK
jgi:hypothetical protein